METKGNKPSLGWAILSLVLPCCDDPVRHARCRRAASVLPLIGAVALAVLWG